MGAKGNYIVEEDIDNWADQEATITESTISFSDNDPNADTILEAGNRFITSGFRANMKILVSGSVSNDGYYTVASVTAGVITLISTDELTDESSGANVTINSCERQETINRIEAIIERLTHDYFYAKAFSVYLNGNGKDKLFLGLVPDILTVTEVKISGVELPSAWWTYDANSIYLDPEAVTSEEEDLPELYLRLRYERALFPTGMGNIKVTGTYGWSSCPAAIKQAAIILCRTENDPTLYPSYGNLKSERLGDYSYTVADNIYEITTGNSAADKLLKTYIRKKPMLSAV